jgi:WD40 repeat protein
VWLNLNTVQLHLPPCGNCRYLFSLYALGLLTLCIGELLMVQQLENWVSLTDHPPTCISTSSVYSNHDPSPSVSSPSPPSSPPMTRHPPYDTDNTSIQALEREFQQVRQHIKILVQKKSKLLREIHTRKHCNMNTHPKSDMETISRWKDISTRYLYAGDSHNSSCGDQNDMWFPLFNILPNEVVLHIFGYLGAKHLCQSVMRVCTSFCAISLDESLWRPLYFRCWGDHRAAVVVNSCGSVTWRSLFGRQSRTERNWWRGHNTVMTIDGHKGAVRCMQFNGDLLITGSADKTIKMWNLYDGRCTQTLHDTKWVRCLRFDVPSATLVTTSMDSTQAKLWSLSTNTITHVLDVTRGWITSLQLSVPRLITGSLDGKIRVWDASTGSNQPCHTINSGHDSLRNICLLDDLVMSAGIERNLQLWDLRTPTAAKPSVTVESAPHGNYCVQFSTRSHTVCSGSNGVIAIADLRAPSAPPTLLRGHTDAVSCLQFSGKKLVTGSMDHTIRVWDLTTQLCANTLHGHESWVWDLQFDPDKIVTASGDKAVKVWAFNHTNDISAM